MARETLVSKQNGDGYVVAHLCVCAALFVGVDKGIWMRVRTECLLRFSGGNRGSEQFSNSRKKVFDCDIYA